MGRKNWDWYLMYYLALAIVLGGGVTALLFLVYVASLLGKEIF